MIYSHLIRPLLFSMDAENAHHLAIKLLSQYSFLVRVCQRRFVVEDERLHLTIQGMRFSNPVGLAAGFDKSADAVQTLPALGFGFLELGTVTPLEQVGNPRPRIFRLPQDCGLINRLGFNNDGAVAVHSKLEKLISDNRPPKIPIGINIGKGKETEIARATDDYLYLFEKLYGYGDYFVVNISSPNTPNLRQLQNQEFLTELVSALQSKNAELGAQLQSARKPLFVKIAPDLTFPQIDAIIQIVIEHEVSGIIATNTTISRDRLRSDIQQKGGLSGKPLGERASKIIRYIYRTTEGRVTLIGVGGIFSAEDAYEKIAFGATLVQVYTGFIYKGPSLVKHINLGLLRLMERDGLKNIEQAVGIRTH